MNGSERRRLFDSIFRQAVAKHIPFAEEADFTNDCSIFDAVLDLRDGQVLQPQTLSFLVHSPSFDCLSVC